MESKKQILNKLFLIMNEVEHMEKDGKNTFQNYNYLSETQVTMKMKELLTKHKVVFFQSSEITGTIEGKTAKGVDQILTNILVRFTFYDVESGESIEGTEAGQGQDSGDKGVYKAITGAIKYIFMKNFLIPTGDDPENEQKTAQHSGTQSRSPAAQPPSATAKSKACPECGTVAYEKSGQYGPYYRCQPCNKYIK